MAELVDDRLMKDADDLGGGIEGVGALLDGVPESPEAQLLAQGQKTGELRTKGFLGETEDVPFSFGNPGKWRL